MTFPVRKRKDIEKSYQDAREMYRGYGVDTDKALKSLSGVRPSLHCWQGDDVGGFEVKKTSLSGGILATGGYPGKARTPDELRKDIEKAASLIPGPVKLNLHAIYLESDGKFVDRDAVGPEHFSRWIDWAKAKKFGLDFNPSFFSHEMAGSGFTLSHQDKAVRAFWIEHALRCREIAAEFSRKLKDVCVMNYWIPDGMKDFPADRWTPRKRLVDSLDKIFKKEITRSVKESVEGKLFGIGSEEYVVGSNEFYLSYALTRGKLPCMDLGHYHPTEGVYDKVSAVLQFAPELLVHVSRPVRWDSDHVVICDDSIALLCKELVRGDALRKVYLATDFFDASINRVGAWVIGIRSLLKGLLAALLDPVASLREAEAAGKGADRLALTEEFKSLPWGAVWDYYCVVNDVPVGPAWIDAMREYEKKVLSKR